MKLWIDAQLSPAVATWIKENFSDIEATAVRELGLRDAEDPVIFFSARTASATVMTKEMILSNCNRGMARRQKLFGSPAVTHLTLYLNPFYWLIYRKQSTCLNLVKYWWKSQDNRG
jgi:predicted nuclease of predicted toxin-antitoxin system